MTDPDMSRLVFIPGPEIVPLPGQLRSNAGLYQLPVRSDVLRQPCEGEGDCQTECHFIEDLPTGLQSVRHDEGHHVDVDV